MTTTAVLDANVILRLLLNDHETLTPAAMKMFQRAETGDLSLILTPLIVAECCYLLRGPVYRIERSAITDSLTQVILMDGIVTEEEGVVLAALRRFGERAVDFADAYLAELAQQRGWEVASFDQDFRALGGSGLPD